VGAALVIESTAVSAAGRPSWSPITDASVSAIVPVYNEVHCVRECLLSLLRQDFRPLEIVVVDDGSRDESARICEGLGVTVLRQAHQGPGRARNLGARTAKGSILVFVDADMVLDPTYVSRLIAPIIAGEAAATCHWNEEVLDWDNPWARCQVYYLGLPERRRQPLKPPAAEEIYRAVRKDFFVAAGGMEERAGRGDDSSVAKRTGVLATIVPDARCYHRGPASWQEVFHDGVWSGRNVTVARPRRFRRSAASLLRTNPLTTVWRMWRRLWTSGEPRLPAYAVLYTAGFDVGIALGLITRRYAK